MGAKSGGAASGLTYRPAFVKAGQDPYAISFEGGKLEYAPRLAQVTNDKGEVVFEQKDVIFPTTYSDNSVSVVASKYFYGKDGVDEQGRENSMQGLVDRVTEYVFQKGLEGNYFRSRRDAENHRRDLAHLLINQAAMFNSPVLFNAGLYESRGELGAASERYRVDPRTNRVVPLGEGEYYKHPQVSACFIIGIEDNMDSIAKLWRETPFVYKGGSGAGFDWSKVRSSHEYLSGGGRPSGPVPFAIAADTIGGVLKSGGKTRRAAIMQTMKDYHPNIMDFVTAKEGQERLAHALIDAGFDPGIEGIVYSSVNFQNSNLSARLSDEFMRTLAAGGEWQTRAIHSDVGVDSLPRFPADELMTAIARGTWVSGDPGVQFEDTINGMHTCPVTGPINSSNPCSEYMHIDDSACNLASINLLKFADRGDGKFDVKRFKQAVDTIFLAQEIIVGDASYPSPKIARNAVDYREIGLGYANLGALSMSKGLAYDSDAARELAAGITALMTGAAYKTSTRIAQVKGAFAGFEENKGPMMEVMGTHRQSLVDLIEAGDRFSEITSQGLKEWDYVMRHGPKGMRNSQATVLAPTGTIAFAMDCDTTGVEPDIALVKYKKLIGGGQMKIVNNTVPKGLRALGYDDRQIEEIVSFIDANDTIEGAPELKPEDLPVFDCAFKPAKGERSIHHRGHLKMMGGIQPFISGAISKTVNMPEEATVEEIKDAYIEAHKLGIKAVAIYRDGCKRAQPLNTARDAENRSGLAGIVANGPVRKRMPARAHTIKERVQFAQGDRNGVKSFYFHVGLYDDGTPGEIFIRGGGEGSEVSGWADATGIALSLGLQYGVPLPAIVDKFREISFPPQGIITQPRDPGSLAEDEKQIRFAKSPPGYLASFLEQQFLDKETRGLVPVKFTKDRNGVYVPEDVSSDTDPEVHSDDSRPREALEELLSKTDSSCPDCSGPAIKKGRCDYYCINDDNIFRGECSE